MRREWVSGPSEGIHGLQPVRRQRPVRGRQRHNAGVLCSEDQPESPAAEESLDYVVMAERLLQTLLQGGIGRGLGGSRHHCREKPCGPAEEG